MHNLGSNTAMPTTLRRGRRPNGSASTASHIAWLINLGQQPEGYWPLGNERVLAEGEALPFKNLVMPGTGLILGRFATAAEECRERASGLLENQETLLFLLPAPRPSYRGRVQPEEAGKVYIIGYHEIPELLENPRVCKEFARRFSPSALARRYSSKKPYRISTMSSERVLWAAIAVNYVAPVGQSLRRLTHFRNSEPLLILASAGARFYVSGSAVTCFFAFREEVHIDEIRPIEQVVEMAFGLGWPSIACIRRSYASPDGEVDSVPGPCSQQLFDPATGQPLEDSAWESTPLVNPGLLRHVSVSGDEPIWRGPSDEDIREIIDVCGLQPTDRWGRRDLWTFSAKGKFALVIPGKHYGEGKSAFRGEPLTPSLYMRHLRRGDEFFANTFNQSHPRWLCIDFDVKCLGTEGRRFSADSDWLSAHINEDAVTAWRSVGLYPQFRLSGRGFYVELFFSAGVERTLLVELANRTIGLLKYAGLTGGFRRKLHAITESGYRIVQDVASLSYLVRMPGSMHHSVGVPSIYLHGGFVPSRERSDPRGIPLLLEKTPSLYTVLSSSSSSLSCVISKVEEALVDSVVPPERCQEGPFEEGSITLRVNSFELDGHLILNSQQRRLTAEAIAADLLSRRKAKRGPAPGRGAFVSAALVLLDQACRTAAPFPMGTRQIQFRISEVTGQRERSRNRASTARQALVDAGYISLVREYRRRGQVEHGFALRGEAAVFSANMEKLRAVAMEACKPPKAGAN